VYRWNGTVDGRWHSVDATFHENGTATATATVEQFSYYTVIDVDSWRSARRVDAVDPVDLGSKSASCSGTCDVTDATLTLGGAPDNESSQ